MKKDCVIVTKANRQAEMAADSKPTWHFKNLKALKICIKNPKKIKGNVCKGR